MSVSDEDISIPPVLTENNKRKDGFTEEEKAAMQPATEEEKATMQPGESTGGKRHRRRMTMKKMKKMSKRKMAKWCKSKKNRRTKAGRKMCKK
jgi:hypothetical protein